VEAITEVAKEECQEVTIEGTEGIEEARSGRDKETAQIEDRDNIQLEGFKAKPLRLSNHSSRLRAFLSFKHLISTFLNSTSCKETKRHNLLATVSTTKFSSATEKNTHQESQVCFSTKTQSIFLSS
jgi:hypothetical protein